MCDESHTWQRSDTYNVWRIAHDKDKGLLFTLNRDEKILQNEKNLKMIPKPKNGKSLWNENFKKF
jgi:hypothetical protein